MTLPQKIRLLADFAGYPAGEYAYYDEKGFPSYLQSYIAGDEPVVVNIHPDIIKATSGQGIRSEVTDGENRLSRPIENGDCSKCGNFGVLYDRSCARCTPQTEPIESSPCTACYGKKQYTQLVTKNYGDEVNEKLVNELADCKRCNATGIEPSPPLESKYEECAKEIYGYLHILMASSDKAAISLIAKLVKEYF